jgi:hypothetical protein
MKVFKIILICLASISFLLMMSYGLGMWDVFLIKTVGKEKQNAKREVYETSQSYVEGKRQEAVKNYHEWLNDTTPEGRESIENIVRLSFSNFDESLLQDPQLQNWIKQCKY